MSAVYEGVVQAGKRPRILLDDGRSVEHFGSVIGQLRLEKHRGCRVRVSPADWTIDVECLSHDECVLRALADMTQTEATE